MVKVRVPATSANMGPGFDSIGIAFNLYNEFEFTKIDRGLEFFGFDKEYCNEDNIVYKAMDICFKKCNYKSNGIRIKLVNQDIPISRGLGSSSSCIVAGLLGANYIMGNILSKDELFKIGVEIEGHPDNIAPAFFGSMVVSVMEEDKVLYNKIDIKSGVKFISIIPNFKLSTELARSVLPSSISFKDAIFNISRAALMVSSFTTGKYELLKSSCKDALHEKYRSPLIENFDKVYDKCMELDVLATFLSGAGPTIVAVIKEDDETILKDIVDFLYKNDIKWEVKDLSVDSIGATMIEGD